MEILIINSGSSSLKYQLIDSVTGESKAKGIVDRIGIDGSLVKYTAITTLTTLRLWDTV